MKTLRYIVATLLLLSGILHISTVLRPPIDATGMQMLAFGIIYFVLGILLLICRSFSPAWGIIFPMIGLVAGFFVIGFQHWTTMLSMSFAINIVIVICCIFLFYYKPNPR